MFDVDYNWLAGVIFRAGFLVIFILLIVLLGVYILRWIRYHWVVGGFPTPTVVASKEATQSTQQNGYQQESPRQVYTYQPYTGPQE